MTTVQLQEFKLLILYLQIKGNLVEHTVVAFHLNIAVVTNIHDAFSNEGVFVENLQTKQRIEKDRGNCEIW